MKQDGRIKGEEQSGSEGNHGSDAVSMCVLVNLSVPQRALYRDMACLVEHAAQTGSQPAMVSAQQPINAARRGSMTAYKGQLSNVRCWVSLSVEAGRKSVAVSSVFPASIANQ